MLNLKKGENMKIVACYKCVPAEPIKVNKDLTLDFSEAAWEVGKYDLAAVEAAMTLASQADGTVLALTANGEIVSNSKMKKTILSRGPEEMFGVQDEALSEADSLTTAEVLRAAVEKMENVDLVICGEGSGDIYAQQVGSTLGALLGWTTVNAVSKIELADNGALQVSRNVSDGVEVLRATLPAVISVTSDISSPRVPSMKEILRAGKKPATVWSLTDVNCALDAVTNTVSVLAPKPAPRKQIIVEGAGEEAIEKFAEYIKKAL